MAQTRESEKRAALDFLLAERKELEHELQRIDMRQPDELDPEVTSARQFNNDLQQDITKRKTEIEQLTLQREERTKRLHQTVQHKVDAWLCVFLRLPVCSEFMLFLSLSSHFRPRQKKN